MRVNEPLPPPLQKKNISLKVLIREKFLVEEKKKIFKIDNQIHKIQPITFLMQFF